MHIIERLWVTYIYKRDRRYMAEKLPIRRKTLYNQSINQSYKRETLCNINNAHHRKTIGNMCHKYHKETYGNNFHNHHRETMRSVYHRDTVALQ